MKLEDIIPNIEIRKRVYQVFGLIGLVIGAIQGRFASVPDATAPAWLGVALTVYAFLGTAGFAVSQANTVVPTAKIVGIPPAEPTATEAEYLIENPVGELPEYKGRHGI